MIATRFVTRVLFNPQSLVGLATKTLNLFCTEPRSRTSDKFGYDNILSRISICDDFDELFEIYDKNRDKISSEHAAIISRSLARNLKKPRSGQVNRVKYAELEQLLVKEMHNLNSQQCLDYLFFLRVMKTRQNSLLSIRFDVQNQFIDIINKHIEAKQYTFRNLVNVYYDLAILNKVNFICINELHAKLKQEIEKNSMRNLSIFNMTQILRAISSRNDLSFKQLEILESCFDLIDGNNLIAELNSTQKADLFQIVGNLDLEYLTPKFLLPEFMTKLKEQFEKQLESLNEKAILLIVEGCAFLPPKFQSLAEQVKTIILDNLEVSEKGEESAISLDFFLTFLLKISKWRRRKFNFEEEQKLCKFLLSQFQTATDVLFEERLNRVLKANVLRNPTIKTLLNQLLPIVKTPGLNLMQLYSNYQIDYQHLLLANRQKYSKLPSYYLCRLYHLIASFPNPSPELLAFKQQLDPIYEKQLSKSVFEVAKALIDARLHYQLTQPLYKRIVDLIYPMQIDTLSNNQKVTYLRIIIRSSCHKSLYDVWRHYLQTNDALLGQMENSIFTALKLQCEVDRYHQLTTFYNILNLKSLPVKYLQLMTILKDLSFIKNSLRHEQHVKRYFNLLNLVTFHQEKQGTNPLTIQVYNIIKKLEDGHCQNDEYHSFLRRIASTEGAIRNNNLFRYFVKILQGKDLLNEEIATSLLKNFERSKIPRDQRTSYNEILLQSYQNKEVLPKFQFFPLSVNTLGLLLMYNPKLYEDKFTAIREIVEGELKKFEWFDLVFALKDYKHAEYKNVARTLIGKCENYLKLFKWNEIIRIGLKLNNIYIKQIKFWNEFLRLYNENLEKMTTEERVNSFAALTTARVFDPVLFEKFFVKVAEDPTYYKSFFTKITQGIIFSGYKPTSEQLDILEKILEAPQTYDIVNYLRILMTVESGNEKRIVAWANKIEESQSSRHYHLLEIIKIKYPEVRSKIELVKAELTENSFYESLKKETNFRKEDLAQYFEKAATLLNLPLEKVVKIGDSPFIAEFKLGDLYIKSINRPELFVKGVPVGFLDHIVQYIRLHHKNNIIVINSGYFLFQQQKKSQFLNAHIPTASQKLQSLDIQFLRQPSNKNKSKEQTLEQST